MLYEQRMVLLDNIAYNVLFHSGINNPCDKLIKDEVARLERIIADLYLKNQSDVDYNKFATDFLKQNTYKIVFTNEYSGDVEIPDEYTELNVNTLINTMHRREERQQEIAEAEQSS